MATYLPSSGAISINDINTLFGRGNNLNSYRGTTYYTSSAGPFTFSSGAIDMNSFHGTGPTANRVALSYTFSTNTANASLNVTSIGGYSAGNSDITITVNSGIYLYSTSTGTPGLTLSGGSTGDTITLVNNGYIMGMGGVGGLSSGSLPGAGGTALSLGFNTTVNNTNASAYIGGGGGGGGYSGGGGGAGGGAGGAGNWGGGSGGTGGGIGASGSTGNSDGGGGGGRVFPGTGGAGATTTSSGIGFPGSGGSSGGGGGAYSVNSKATYRSGSGGSGSSAGSNETTVPSGLNGGAGGGGGGWGASGGKGRGDANQQNNGAAGGKAVALNGYTVTWVSGNTTRVYGAVS